MANRYCPAWVFNLSVTKVAYEFIVSDLPIKAYAKKYSSGLNEHYGEIKAEEIESAKSKVLTKELLEVGDRVYFDYDQSKFKREGVETLKRQARFLLANPNITITVEGHCDQRGTREYNLALGQRRAFSVKNFLVSLGIESDRITVISYGKEKLQSTYENKDSWALNRTAITIINP